MKNNQLIIATEIKALLKKFSCIEKSALKDFLLLGYVPGSSTIFNSIKKIPPSHLLFYEKGNIKLIPYQNWPKNKYSYSEKFYIAELRSHFRNILSNLKDKKTG